MRFVDASVFVYAFLKPRRELTPREAEAKERAKNIVRRINEGERVGITVAQLVEVANVLEKYMGKAAHQVEHFLLHAPNVWVYPVDKGGLRRGAKGRDGEEDGADRRHSLRSDVTPRGWGDILLRRGFRRTGGHQESHELTSHL